MLCRTHVLPPGGTIEDHAHEGGGPALDSDPEQRRRAPQNRSGKRIALFVTVLLLIVGWTLLFMYTEPEEVIAWIGVENSYLVGFLISVFGALGSVTPFSTYPAVYAMASAEVNLFILVPLVAVGLTVGDALFFFFGVTAQDVIPERVKARVDQLWNWLEKKPDLYIQIFLYVWVGLSPLANNLITAPLAVAGYRFRKIVVPLTLGNCSLPIVASYLGMING